MQAFKVTLYAEVCTIAKVGEGGFILMHESI